MSGKNGWPPHGDRGERQAAAERHCLDFSRAENSQCPQLQRAPLGQLLYLALCPHSEEPIGGPEAVGAWMLLEVAKRLDEIADRITWMCEVPDADARIGHACDINEAVCSLAGRARIAEELITRMRDVRQLEGEVSQ